MNHRALSDDRLTREDVVLFINAAFACTSQDEFYGPSAAQSVSLDFLHAYIAGNYRRLYARSLAAGINHFNSAKAVETLLCTPAPENPRDRAEEAALINAALDRLPTHRAYRALETLARRGVNHRRARAVAKAFFARRRNLSFEAVKYRRRMVRIARHFHLNLPGETGAFLFEGRRRPKYETPLFEKFREAQYAAEAIYALPYSIAEGLAQKHGVPRATFLERIEAQMTAHEKLRLERSSARAGRQTKVSLTGYGLTRLALYGLSLPSSERQARDAEFSAAFEASAARVPMALGHARVAAVLDGSYSASGSSEKRRRPLAVAVAVDKLLAQGAAAYRGFWCGGAAFDATRGASAERAAPGGISAKARGTTDLATPLIAALEWGADLVVIVSDGFENDPAGGVDAVVRAFRLRLDPDRKVSVVHANPVFDDDHLAPRALSTALPTVGLRAAEDLPTMLGFARLADGTAELSDLEDYLAIRVAKMLEAS